MIVKGSLFSLSGNDRLYWHMLLRSKMLFPILYPPGYVIQLRSRTVVIANGGSCLTLTVTNTNRGFKSFIAEYVFISNFCKSNPEITEGSTINSQLNGWIEYTSYDILITLSKHFKLPKYLLRR